jgi:hypothetical protein
LQHKRTFEHDQKPIQCIATHRRHLQSTISTMKPNEYLSTFFQF